MAYLEDRGKTTKKREKVGWKSSGKQSQGRPKPLYNGNPIRTGKEGTTSSTKNTVEDIKGRFQ